MKSRLKKLGEYLGSFCGVMYYLLILLKLFNFIIDNCPPICRALNHLRKKKKVKNKLNKKPYAKAFKCSIQQSPALVKLNGSQTVTTDKGQVGKEH